MAQQIGKLIVGAASLAMQARNVNNKKTPGAPAELLDKARWLQCTVKNKTQFPLLFQASHFDSGRYWDTPGSIEPFDQIVFSCCEGDNTFMTGVSGGSSFRIVLDEKTNYDFAIGWTNPRVGTFKASVKESSNAEDGYDCVNSNGNSITSTKKYQGKDEDGEQITFEFHISASPGQQALYVVTQVHLN